MIDREFIEKIEDMTGPKVIETVQGTFSDKHLYRIENELADTIVLSSLSGLAEMIKQEMNEYNLPLFVRATSAERVHVFGAIRDDMQRERPFTAEAKFIGFDFNEYISIENMIICLKSRFAPTEDRDYLVQLLGNITDQQSVQTKDDGITQSATVKSGIQLVGEQRIKPIVTLRPYRTFLETKQPESDFLIRLKDGRAALFEADGGAWEREAVKNIADKLRELLEDVPNVHIIE
jgi:hypothetical protein|nr:MAG TPA: hypothetical protein [Caudoviricetes sp.]